MTFLKDRLQRAIWQGALLSAAAAASCGGQSDDGDPSNSSGGSTSGSGGTSNSSGGSSGSSGSGGTAVAGGLPFYPQATYPQCSGPELDGGYFGQCCVSPHCFTPESGVCPPAEEAHQHLPEFPPGSGECTCTPEGGSAVVGPYRARSTDTPVTAGECCYLVGSIGCEGRPLVVAGLARVARTVRRGDWARAPRAPLGVT